MTSEPKTSSQDYGRKHKKDHVAENPRAAKDITNKNDSKADDARNLVRQEHTNHFTNRAPADQQ